jgi:hypothetical protein
MRLPKVGDGIVIGVLVRRQISKGQILIGGSLDLELTTPRQYPYSNIRTIIAGW